ncbi:MAG: DUF721 domain-containing protein [Kiritimatiellae bacterium]|nr:DUF721 domain-containing protein [Kiritimatiellia bacterium]MDW8458768.1 DUF721 domain-containing protein [Verrucomicrobiota bacterium]
MNRFGRTRRLSPGRWQVERERFQLPPDCPPVQAGEAVSIGDLTAAVLSEAGLESRMWSHALLNEWADLVGPAIARRARPGSLEKGVLTVFVSNAVWQQELQRFGQAELLKKLQARFGAGRITRIRFAPDPDLRGPDRSKRGDC